MDQLDVDYPTLKKMLTAINVPTDINCQGHALHKTVVSQRPLLVDTVEKVGPRNFLSSR